MNVEIPSRSCTECGQPIAVTATFCRSCGARYAPPEPKQEAGSEASAQPLRQPPAPTSKPSPARRWGRVALIVVGALVLVGASAGATVLLLGQDESSEGTGEQPTISSVPVDGDADSQRSGEAVSGSTGTEPSTQEAAAMASEIQPSLLAFYEDVVAHRYRDAWERLSERKRQQNLREYTYREWAEEGVGSLADYLDPSGLTVRVDGVEADGSVRVLLTGMTWSDPDSPCSEWSGLTWVKLRGWGVGLGFGLLDHARAAPALGAT